MHHLLLWSRTFPLLGVLVLSVVGCGEPQKELAEEMHDIQARVAETLKKIDSVEDAWVGDAIKVSVFLSIFNVHVNRTPCAGRVDQVAHIPGRFRLAFVDKASDDNERTEIALDGSCGRVIVKQIAGFVARRIVCHLTPQQQVEAGERFGLIRFGSRVDHIVSAKADIRVTVNDRVRGGETVIGVLTP